MQNDRKNRNGQVLIEALIAISVLTIGFLGVLALLNRSLSLNRVVAENYAATYLAAEGIEVVKNLIDEGMVSGQWGAGFAECATANGCEVEYDTTWENSPSLANRNRELQYDPSTRLYSYAAGGARTSFKRVVHVRSNGPDELVVTSEVDWTTRGGAAFDVTLEDHFFRWYIPTGS